MYKKIVTVLTNFFERCSLIKKLWNSFVKYVLAKNSIFLKERLKSTYLFAYCIEVLTKPSEYSLRKVRPLTSSRKNPLELSTKKVSGTQIFRSINMSLGWKIGVWDSLIFNLGSVQNCRRYPETTSFWDFSQMFSSVI